ncbi:MAG: stage III sporulation protein AF [Lachnospiraceae bacterium]|nr:stage III sporulation protein AF [Lachnospiraceae bacterium]
MIVAWMKGLVIYLILSGLVMKMVPGKNYEKYISLYMGFILVIMLAKPVIMLLFKKDGDVENLMDKVDNYLSFDVGNISDINEGITYYELGVGEDLKLELIKNGYDVSKVTFVGDEKKNVMSVTLYMTGEFDEKDIKKYINDVYNIDYESIYIVRR